MSGAERRQIIIIMIYRFDAFVKRRCLIQAGRETRETDSRFAVTVITLEVQKKVCDRGVRWTEEASAKALMTADSW